MSNGASKTLPVRQGGHVGIFLDPPYHASTDRAEVYSYEDMGISEAVREWALARGTDADTRIVLAGFEGEHDALESHGWRVVEWYRSGFLKGGMGNVGVGGHQQKRERLWLSPHCLGAEEPIQATMWGAR